MGMRPYGVPHFNEFGIGEWYFHIIWYENITLWCSSMRPYGIPHFNELELANNIFISFDAKISLFGIAFALNSDIFVSNSMEILLINVEILALFKIYS
jgi:hypothetical protein